MFIRFFKIEDLDFVIDVFINSITKIACANYSSDQINAWIKAIDKDKWLKKRENRFTWVAVKNNKTVGFADLEPDGHIDMLYVHSDFKRQKIASNLLETIYKKAKELDINKLYVEASKTAKPFFEKQNFIVIKKQKVKRYNQELINFCMYKDLI